MQFRFAQQSDFPLVAALNHELLASDANAHLFSEPELVSRLARWVSEGHQILLFNEGDATVGYALYEIRPFETKTETVFLRHFLIKPGSRRKGLGRTALAYLLDHVWPKSASVAVETKADNDPAIQLWHSFGFRHFSSVFVRKAN